jgi:hypothetical protein
MFVSLVAASLLISDVILSALQLATTFNEIAAKMNAEGRTELTPEEWDRIKSKRKEAVKRAMETD